MERDYGPDSAMYQAKVLGQIPEGGAGAVVELRWIEAAMLLEADPRDMRPAVITCDVAREGEDLTVVGKIHKSKFSIKRWKASNDTMECAGMCRAAVIEEQATMLVIDDTGVGGGVTDRVREMQREKDANGNFKFPPSCTIIGVKFGASAERDDRFHSKKDELYWSTRDTLKAKKLALPTEHEINALQLPRGFNLKAQLSAPIYEEDSQSRIRVLDKRVGNTEKTKALPTKSPDLAHALILGPYYWARVKPDETVPKPKTTTELFEAQMREAMKAKHRNAKKPPTPYPGRNW
jgi:phage terminase large subunit